MTKPIDRFVRLLEEANLWHLLWISVLVSIGMTEGIVSLMSLFFWGRVTADYLITGAVAAALVSFVVVAVIAVFVEKLRERSLELQAFNAGLEKRVSEEIERRRDQEQLLIQQARLAAMGEMIRAVAHHWRQPLNVIAIEVQELEDMYAFGELDRQAIREKVERTMRQVRALSDVIDDFRDFFRASKERRRFDAKEAVREAIEIVAAQYAHHRIGLGLSTPDTPCFVMGYPNEFKQVLINLMGNAKDAILEKRRILGEEADGKVEIALKQDADQITLLLKDNGTGISSAIAEKIFEPYFTTKVHQGGTGIGLYMAKMIVEKNMGGFIAARNLENGAEFTIVLPRA